MNIGDKISRHIIIHHIAKYDYKEYVRNGWDKNHIIDSNLMLADFYRHLRQLKSLNDII